MSLTTMATANSEASNEHVDSKTKWDDQGPLPPPDYYIYDEYEWMVKGNKFLESKEFSPVSRNAIEIAYKIFLERDLRSYLYTNYEPERNSPDDKQVDLICLTRRPPCYVLFGKPGVGKTTLAARLAQKLNAVHISAVNVLEFYKTREPAHGIDVKEILNSGGTVDDMMILQLFDRRIKEMDVLHRGYVLDDFPLLVSEQVPIQQQIQILQTFVLVPDFAIVFYMQDVDIFKRRIDQKFDPETQQLYIKAQYDKVATEDEYKSNVRSPVKPTSKNSTSTKSESRKGGSSTSTDVTKDVSYHGSDVAGFKLHQGETLDGSNDFPPISFGTHVRLVSRLEDNSILVNDELEKFREASIFIQEFVDTLDKRKILEVNAYMLPSIVFKKVWSYLEGYGITPSPVPSQIIRPMKRVLESYRNVNDQEFDGESCEPDDGDIDWEASYRAISVRGTIDPRFRWRISLWRNLCPVALKLGKSIAGRPEFAVSFLNKAYFLSSQEAVEQFINNPRPFLLPEMPTSPVKYFVIGHPLSGKSMIAKEIATLCSAEVVDMNKEIVKRYDQVKFDYLLRHKIQITFDAIRIVERENKAFWKRGERSRRKEMHSWIDKHLKGIVTSVILLAVEDEEARSAERAKTLADSYDHKMGEPYMGSGSCQVDSRFRKGFSWEAFIKECREGKINWTHQERLELAVDLFKQGRLYYKTIFHPKRGEQEGEGDGESLEKLSKEYSSDNSAEDDEETEEDDEGSEGASNKDDYNRTSNESGESEEKSDDASDDVKLLVGPNQRPKRRCKKKKKWPEKELMISRDTLEGISPALSSILDADEELEESIMLRFPTIPRELVESVPKPDKVNEKHPVVYDIIARKMKAVEENSNEAEIYLEILRRGILEAESRYRVMRPGGPLTGGWVVDNLLPDIDKWRLILRTHDVAPDQVIVLVDHSPNYENIFTRLKRLYRKLHSKLKDADADGLKTASATKGEIPGEADPFDNEGAVTVIASSTGQEDLSVAETAETSDLSFMEVITESSDIPEDAPSLAMLVERDARRQQSVAGSKCTSIEDIIRTVGISMKEGPEVIELYRSDKPESRKGGVKSEEISKVAISPNSVKKNQMLSSKRPNFEMGTYVTDSQKQIKCSEVTMTKGGQILEDKGESSHPNHPEDFPEFTHKPIGLIAHPLQSSLKGNEFGGEVDNKTPSGLLSLLDLELMCAEDAGPEDPCVLAKQNEEPGQKETSHPISGKRRFMMEVRQFELFWNMVIPVLNEQEIRYWEMGVVDEDTVKEKISIILEELQARFRDYPIEADKDLLGDEEADARESLKRCGNPIKPLRRYLQEAEDEDVEEEEYEEESDNAGPEKSEGLIMEDTDPLSPLEAKPDIYREAAESIESLRLFGEFKEYCPVTFAEKGILRKGFQENAVKYKHRLYYFTDSACKARFLMNPRRFVPDDVTKKPPVPRICITGSPGCQQEEIGLALSKEYGICFINFRERLHDLLKARMGKEVGPAKTGVIVPLYRTMSMIAKAASRDDMLSNAAYFDGHEEEDSGESSDIIYSHSEKFQDGSVHDVVLQSLGLLNTARVATNPLSSISRTETLARRKWQQLSKKEIQIKAFLENGTQLPDSILDEFIAPLWSQKPFTDVGFILTGFPNTEYDNEYLVSKDLIPEQIFILECNPLVIRNRLLIETVDRWHQQNNPSGKRKVSIATQEKLMPMATRGASGQGRHINSAVSGNSSMKSDFITFEYQQEGRPEIEEFVEDTWSYNDTISKNISEALRHYHNIYSKDIIIMKKSLNRARVDWTAYKADLSLVATKNSLMEKLHSMLKYRSSILEATVELNFHQANALISGGFFELSKFRRWCPVEIAKGNDAINMWFSRTLEKVPILHRRYVYFTAGKENAARFKENVAELIKTKSPTPAYPLTVVVLGNPNSGKTTVAQRLADYFGFAYISGTTMIKNILKHSSNHNISASISANKLKTAFNASQNMITADEVLCYLENGKEIPNFILYRVLDLALMDPRAQHHGVIFDDYPDSQQLHDFIERGAIPAVVAKLKLDINEAYERNMKKFTTTHDFESPTVEQLQFMIDATAMYDEKLKTSYDWFANEIQSLFNVDSSQSPCAVFTQIKDRCIKVASLIRNYTVSIQNQKPVALEGTSPLTSEIPTKMSTVFGKFCPVALTDNEEMIAVEDLTNLSRIVEYDSQLFAFSSDEAVQKFIATPTRYLSPGCALLSPEDLPKKHSFTEKEIENLIDQWGFADFDPVMYSLSGFHPKALQRGNPKYTVEYENKYFVFTSESNQELFMKKPMRFASVDLPAKLPRKFEPLDMEKISPYSYIAASGLLPELRKVINLLGTKRPHVPFMSHDRCCALYMAYYFKTLNMNAPFTVRKKYREAMFQMMNHKMNVRDLLRDLKEHYGIRLKKLPDKLKKSLDEFLELATKKDEEKVLIPTIPNLTFNYESIPRMDDLELTQLVEDLLEAAKKADKIEKEGAFLKYAEKRRQNPMGSAELFY